MDQSSLNLFEKSRKMLVTKQILFSRAPSAHSKLVTPTRGPFHRVFPSKRLIPHPHHGDSNNSHGINDLPATPQNGLLSSKWMQRLYTESDRSDSVTRIPNEPKNSFVFNRSTCESLNYKT